MAAKVYLDTRTKKKSYRVAYKRPDGTNTTKGGFNLKREAEAFAATVDVSKLQGSYIAPSDSKATVGVLGKGWLAAHKAAVKPSTLHSDESAWRIHVEPRWGARPVGSIKHTEVAGWVAELSDGKSATTVKRCHGVLAAILDGAVRDRRIMSNPAREVKMPRKVSKPRAYLSHRQVERLAEESRYPDFIRFLAYTGLRWGEATGLRVMHVNQARRRVQIDENAVVVNGHVQVGTPKTHERRAVPYPAFLDPAISAAIEGKRPEALLWLADSGGYLSPGNAASGWFGAAVKRVQAEDVKVAAKATAVGEEERPVMPRVTPHDLRHTAASLAISAGANVKAVQRMLGHASAAMTLDRYAELFDDDLDGVAEALDRHRAASLN
ncbi:tyrosine-type recombinase/integrase [Salinibacterium sp. SWN139]|uniref:tyrosine-type recombinase/integrase n=1 Tax=Salinibacterium sp. SWN139 TaxID=2792055 RepID=UPI0018CD2101|nr:site-specific integrase [Salinibacterium sp. SWN139]MBH0053183.1 tyrosine-type recombinase/integrase [Salinibacterium sp. SWN139]